MLKLRQLHSHTARRPTADHGHSSGPSSLTARIVRDSEDGAILTVHVQPKATRSACVGIHGDALKIRIAAPPVAGAANRELRRFLADELSLPTASVHIESGETNRHKRVRLEGTTAVRVMSRLMPQGIPKRVRALTAWALCTIVIFSACSGPRPILYDNPHLKTVGKEAADQDIDACREAAEAAGAQDGSGKAGGVAKNTAVGAGVGAASGAVGGAISGSPGLGSAIGAASGAVWGLLMGLFNASSSQPSPAYTNYVNRCLQEKGYEVTGWQ